MNLSFDPQHFLVTVDEEGDIEFLDLYRGIREWEASEEGIVFPTILEGSGNDRLPDGTRTPRTMIFLGGWKLRCDKQISIVNGYVTGRNQDGYYDPIADDSTERIRILSSREEEAEFVPTEAQKRYALEQGALFAQDWEVLTEPRKVLRRKEGAEERKHKVFGLYWFLKQQWLRNRALRAFSFPIRGDNRIPREGLVREWEWSSDWKIRKGDLKYLEDGPLYVGGAEVVPPLQVETDGTESKAPLTSDVDSKSIWASVRGRSAALGAWLNQIWKGRPKIMTRAENRARSVTIGVVTVLPEEYAAVECQLDNQIEHIARDGRKNNSYVIGTMPAFADGTHVIATAMTSMGNNTAAIRASALIHDFPNLQEVIMVGIAGAVPNAEDVETHVRLGDVVVSGENGVVQYDFTKETGDAEIENRHRPRPPSAELIRAVRKLEAEFIRGRRPWMEELERAPQNMRDSRPSEEEDKLADSDDPDKFLDHPNDATRYPGEPRIFLGTIGAANKLLKNAKQRDQLRDKFAIRAIEMESSGISDAADEYDIAYFVVRGTCDYCDTHKNDKWHVYAATIAAAYCRALLRKTPAYRLRI